MCYPALIVMIHFLVPAILIGLAYKVIASAHYKTAGAAILAER
jgi:hypothetical protein